MPQTARRSRAATAARTLRKSESLNFCTILENGRTGGKIGGVVFFWELTPVASTSDNISVTIASAIKELAAITMHLTNIAEIIRKNIETYWAIKDAASRRSAYTKIMQLSNKLSFIGFLQATHPDQRVAEILTGRSRYKKEEEIAAVISVYGKTVEEYTNQVDEIMTLLKESFPELVKSELSTASLKMLLDKKRWRPNYKSFCPNALPQTMILSSGGRDQIVVGKIL